MSGSGGGAWRSALIILALGLMALGLVFAEEIAAAVEVWETSTSYNHCWLVAPVAGWLAWQRRHRLVLVTPRPTAVGALLALPAGLAWLAAERLGIMEGRQLALLGMTWALALAVLGWRACHAMVTPLLYLAFLVPFGTFAVPALQDVTARFIDLGLDLLEVPHYADGVLIETRVGTFHVAEACAGLRFVIAALAFGALYASVMFRTFGRRLAVMALALIIPVLTNGLRALGIVVLAEHLGSAAAAAADHLVYGWLFFSVVILLLILLGLPFRQDELPPVVLAAGPRRPERTSWRDAPPAAGLVLLLAATVPTVAAALNGAASAPLMVPLALASMPGCETTADGLRCEGVVLTARLFVFSPRVTWQAVSVARYRAAVTGDEDATFRLYLPGQPVWEGRQPAQSRHVVALAAWLDGLPASDGLGSRLRQARNSLGLGQGRPVLAVVEMQPKVPLDMPAARDLLHRLLAAENAAQGVSGGDGIATRAAMASAGR